MRRAVIFTEDEHAAVLKVVKDKLEKLYRMRTKGAEANLLKRLPFLETALKKLESK